jgi:hypothetical protein
MHGCSDERRNGQMRLYIRTHGFCARVFGKSRSTVHGMDYWLRYTPAFEVVAKHSIPECVEHLAF